MKLEGKVALVTGGNRGIGEEIVRLFSAEGAQVVFCGRREALCKQVEESVCAIGGDVTGFGTDLSHEDEVEKLIQAVIDCYGRLDIVVNNAGIAPAGPVEAMSLEEWNTLLACNLTSAFLVSKHAIPRLRAAGGGAIINLGSTFGVVGAAGSAAYAMTKAALMNYTKSLALELAPDGIRVNALCPGGTDTQFLRDWMVATGDAAGTEAWLVAHHPLGRLGRPEEQAKGALFLACDDSSFVTGHSLLVDGGYTAQ
jgi:NAD(P)-dependent dehydrogenase (short-subunit alcohol dehydrogenase family)